MKNHPPVKHAWVYAPRVIGGDNAEVPPGNCTISGSRGKANRDHDPYSLRCAVGIHFKT